MAAFTYLQAEEIRDALKRHGVQYLFIGQSAAVLHGFPYRRRMEIEGFPVCSLDDIIASKAASNRQKDRDSLPRLRAFRDHLRHSR